MTKGHTGGLAAHSLDMAAASRRLGAAIVPALLCHCCYLEMRSKVDQSCNKYISKE